MNLIKPKKYGIRKKNKNGKVMHEWKSGKLKSGSGKKVTDKKQAIAIAINESMRKK